MIHEQVEVGRTFWGGLLFGSVRAVGTGRSWLLQLTQPLSSNPLKDPCSPAKLQKLRVGKGRRLAQRAYVLYIFTTVSIFIGFFYTQVYLH